MMHFRDFVHAYNCGTVNKDAAWRAYDIEHHADKHKDLYVRRALKQLGERGGVPSCTAKVASEFGLGTTYRARMLLSQWAVWRAIATGSIKRGVKERE